MKQLTDLALYQLKDELAAIEQAEQGLKLLKCKTKEIEQFQLYIDKRAKSIEALIDKFFD